MFNASFISLLAADAAMVSRLNTYAGNPAIFSEVAPEAAETTYIVFDIEKTSADNLAVAAFLITVDIYDVSPSGKIAREIEERIEFICDREEIKGDARFDTIRLFYEDGRPIENKDVAIRKRVVTLSARAGRKKWMEETA